MGLISRVVLAGLCFLFAGIGGAVIIVPRPPMPPPPMPLRSVTAGDTSATVTVRDDVARVRMGLSFHNPNSRPAEADVYIPIPADAGITDFAIMMNGKMTAGEVLDADAARKTYEDIVRTMRDPGLLEFSERGLAHVRLFPIPAGGEMAMEMEYMQVLGSDLGMRRLTLPLGVAGKSDAGKGATVQVALDAVRNVYSPTDTIDTKTCDSAVTVTMKREAAARQRTDFVLYYETPTADLALGLLAERDHESTQGTFMLLFEPPPTDERVTSEPVRGQDFVFVIDKSGSMNEDKKMEQAQRALKGCIARLRDNDRFAIIEFANSVGQWDPQGLVYATADRREAAAQWVDEIRANGGTNISDAMDLALKLPSTQTGSIERLRTVLFFTDGQPTVGKTNADEILKDVAKNNVQNLRVFTFGLGFDVNTKLLDAMAENTRAVSDYVRPNEDLELPVSRLFGKISKPAMTDLTLKIDGVKTDEMFPMPLPDLFYGSRLTLLGRYDAGATATITLSGTRNGHPVTHTFEREFPSHTPNVSKRPERTFLEKLWATRKVGWLMQQIWHNGDNKELREQLETLGKKYAIATPFTSMLVAEDKPVARPGIRATAAPQSGRARDSFYASFAAPAGFAGESAVVASKAMSATRRAESVSDFGNADGFSRDEKMLAGGVTLSATSAGQWRDSRVDAGRKPDIVIRTMSEAWFEAVRLVPLLKEAFSEGDNVVVQLPNGLVVECSADTGTETLADEQRKQLAAK